MNHRIGSLVFGVVAGLAVAVWSYQWITQPREERGAREGEERVVLAAREMLTAALGLDSIEIIDPLAPKRSVGKVYVYPYEEGWQVSGFYRRSAVDRWHPFLVTMTADTTLLKLKVRDPDKALLERAQGDTTLEILR